MDEEVSVFGYPFFVGEVRQMDEGGQIPAAAEERKLGGSKDQVTECGRLFIRNAGAFGLYCSE